MFISAYQRYVDSLPFIPSITSERVILDVVFLVDSTEFMDVTTFNLVNI